MRRIAWSPKATWLLKQLYGGVPAKVLAEVLGVQQVDVRNRARFLGLCKPQRCQRVYWSTTELQLLREIYPDVPGRDVAALLDRDLSSVHRMAHQLGLGKSEAFNTGADSGRMRRGSHPNSVAYRFKPGVVPWNKGTHFVAGGRSATTRFKKGCMSGAAQHNYVPIGSYRFSKDGYLEQKVTDDPALYPARRWKPVARIVWEQHHGPVPAGHMVVFKRGQFSNRLEEITVDRLECISRAENARRNHWNNNLTLKALVPLKTHITRQVNRIAREARERTTA